MDQAAAKAGAREPVGTDPWPAIQPTRHKAATAAAAAAAAAAATDHDEISNEHVSTTAARPLYMSLRGCTMAGHATWTCNLDMV
jgi:Tfp pilus assembly major pilin PilA